jgi:hypothetical protein
LPVSPRFSVAVVRIVPSCRPISSNSCSAALSVLARHVENGRIEQLPEIEAALVECLLIPYLGAAKSKRIAA